MDEYESLSHSKWECKYHVVFIPKCRLKALYGQLRKYLGEVFRSLAEQKESRVEEGHLLSDQCNGDSGCHIPAAWSFLAGITRVRRRQGRCPR